MTEPSKKNLSAASINSLPPEARTALLESLNPDEAEFLCADWPFWARPEQLPPPGDWRIWLFLGGRGAGKTRSGAEWILESVREGAMRRVALVGATYADVRDVMIAGESGLLAAGRAEGLRYESSKRQVHWPDGAIAQAFTAEEPDGLRGHQFDGAWLDEIGAPAIDKGSNEPNVFFDPKSSESAAPYFSNGERDDLIQRRFLEAHLNYWPDTANNPPSSVYG
jgi:hypothetical protein